MEDDNGSSASRRGTRAGLGKRTNGKAGYRRFVCQVLIVYGIGTAFALAVTTLWFAAPVFLLAFGAILLAVVLYDASLRIAHWLRVPRPVALAAEVIVALVGVALAGWFLVPRVEQQASELVDSVTNAVHSLQAYVDHHRLFKQAAQVLPKPSSMAGSASTVALHAGSIFSGVLGTMADIVVALFVAVYLAANPRVYTNGIVALLPHRARPRAREVLNELRRVLGLWILGKLLSMLVVGVATAIGLSLLGVPVALALGLLAGLLDFIPYIGSILAAAPAVLIAFTQSPMLALEVSALFLAVHALDGYVLLPLVERKTVSLPPALTISAQVLMGLAFGLGGVALATPLTAVAEVLIQMLYVQDALHDTRTPPAPHD